MINWEILYNRVLTEKVSLTGEKHHNIPKHDRGTDADGITILPRRYHILAHYIRYRQLKQYGDRVAYRMMHGQLLNPMHDPGLKEAHKRLMATVEERAKRKGPKSTEHISNMKKARKRYIATLTDPSILTEHLQTQECREKAIAARKQGNLENPQRVLERAKRAGVTTKLKNLKLSKAELNARYGSAGITNGKWKGYVVVAGLGVSLKYDTIKQAAAGLNLAYPTVLNAIKKGKLPEKAGIQASTIYLTKEETL